METLKRAIKAQNIVLIAGSGITAATTNNHEAATWVGLIKSGQAHARKLNTNLNEDWDQLVNSQIEFGEKYDEVTPLIQAAGTISNAIKDLGPQAYANWLTDVVGELPVCDESTAKALLSLQFPILTTNYDTLLEKVGNRQSAVWTDGKSMQSVIAGNSNAIGHLHGIWGEPDSVILSETDYAQLCLREDAQFLQRAFSGIKTVVYLGFGRSLGDPNFSRLLDWHRKTFATSGVTHFRLCLESEYDDIARYHAGDNIKAVAYGSHFSNLAVFLRDLAPDREAIRLTPAGIARDIISEVQQAWTDELKADSIIAEILHDETREISELILPPVLLPVPHSEYVKTKSSVRKRKRIERLDPEREAQSADVVLLVGEDGQGLSTAIKWMALRSAIGLESAVPIYVDFRECKKGDRPLDVQIRKDAIRRNLLRDKNSPMPPYVLALDDFSPSVPFVSEKVFRDLARNEPIFTVIGCKYGSQDEIVERFKSSGIEARVLYLGSINEGDVERLAKFASPSTSEKLAKNVISILREENLPRNPFTAALLISIHLRGGTVATSASQTIILEQYVSDLLGRGDPHEDSRFSIDQPGREVLLASLAQHFVNSEVSGLSVEEVENFFGSVFKQLGWTERPSAMLNSFLERRVLILSKGHIKFTRSSYLHLFAAKRAGTHPSFRDQISTRPLYYASILKAYSALTRHDEALLKDVSLLFDRISEELEDKGSSFQELELSPAPEVSDEVNLSESAENDEDPEVTSSSADVEKKPNEYSALDFLDEDSPPFPSDDESSMPFGVRLFRTLDLVSTVLRDSDQIENQELKRAVLVRTLETWGRLISALNVDRSFQEFMREVASDIVDELSETEIGKDVQLEPEERLELIGEILKAIPPAVALGGIHSSLASRKLLSVFKKSLESKDFETSEETAIAAAFFIFALKEEGWPSDLMTILESQKNLWVVRNFILYLCLQTFATSELTTTDANGLLELCAEIFARSTQFSSPGERNNHIALFKQRMKKVRLQNRAITGGPQSPAISASTSKSKAALT